MRAVDRRRQNWNQLLGLTVTRVLDEGAQPSAGNVSKRHDALIISRYSLDSRESRYVVDAAITTATDHDLRLFGIEGQLRVLRNGAGEKSLI